MIGKTFAELVAEHTGQPVYPPPELLPPFPFDVKLGSLTPSVASECWQMAEAGLIDGYLLDGQRWVRRDQLQEFLPAGVCAYDPLTSPFTAPGAD